MSKREEVVKVEEAKKKAEAAEAGKYTPKSDEEARQMLKALDKWLEDKKKVDEKPKEEPKPEPKPKEEPKPDTKPKSDPKPDPKPKEEPKPDPKPKEEPKPDTKPKSDPKPKAKEDVIPANDSGLIDGAPGSSISIGASILGSGCTLRILLSPIGSAVVNGLPSGSIMKDGKVHHELNEEETLKYCQQ